MLLKANFRQTTYFKKKKKTVRLYLYMHSTAVGESFTLWLCVHFFRGGPTHMRSPHTRDPPHTRGPHTRGPTHTRGPHTHETPPPTYAGTHTRGPTYTRLPHKRGPHTRGSIPPKSGLYLSQCSYWDTERRYNPTVLSKFKHGTLSDAGWGEGGSVKIIFVKC